MGKKILLLLATTLLVVSCNKSEIQSENNSANPALANSGVSFDEVYSKIKAEYKESTIMENCLANSVNMCLSQAVNERARTKNDESVCDDLSDSMAVEFCKQGIIISKVDKTGNIALCDSLKQNKDNCISQSAMSLAIKKKDLSICDVIKTPKTNSGSALPPMMSTKENCINQASFNLAMASQDDKYCDKISTDSQKKMCKDSIAMQKNNGIKGPNAAGTPVLNPAPTPAN
ncbi:MAG: hypothetical protein PHS92_02125 [Candidatus Gracilibacteria bacterium]|nr:hypothetical protein [Candidatus Gracilibacteria bacterium]